MLTVRRLHTDKKEALFAMRTRLLSSPNKAWLGGKEVCLEVKEVREVKAVCFANHRRSSVSLDNTIQQFLIGRLALCCRARRSTSYLFTFLLFYLFTLKHCCPVKTFSYGFREAGPLCETHCKPRSGAAVGG